MLSLIIVSGLLVGAVALKVENNREENNKQFDAMKNQLSFSKEKQITHTDDTNNITQERTNSISKKEVVKATIENTSEYKLADIIQWYVLDYESESSIKQILKDNYYTEREIEYYSSLGKMSIARELARKLKRNGHLISIRNESIEYRLNK